ncbi:MAG: hypothetical protein IJR13_10120 [Bacteroidales bacterium]|nr:hypothetical protein [Bacteroidales bacterium]
MNTSKIFRHIGRILTLCAIPTLFFACGDKDTDKIDNGGGNGGGGGDTTSTSTVGALSGIFSVSETQKVAFSKGNLQYQPSTGLFRFAENQYDYVGDANKTIGNDTLGLWFDLFGWGTSGYHNEADSYNKHYLPDDCGKYDETVNGTYNFYGFGPSTNMTDADLVGTSAQYDWGVFNAITNGGNIANNWRTLTKDEWVYLLTQRSASTLQGTENARYAKAKLNVTYDTITVDVSGLIIFPDSYSHPEGVPALSRINSAGANYNQTITADDWKKMEDAGCVFLPAAGRREIANRNNARRIVSPGTVGNYWSTTHSDFAPANGNLAYELLFSFEVLDANSSNNRDGGRSVRLVQNR